MKEFPENVDLITNHPFIKHLTDDTRHLLQKPIITPTEACVIVCEVFSISASTYYASYKDYFIVQPVDVKQNGEQISASTNRISSKQLLEKCDELLKQFEKRVESQKTKNQL